MQVRLSRLPARHAKPGELVLEWRIDPPSAVSECDAAGAAILALSDEAAGQRRPAVQELKAMQQAVIQATRRAEVEVLEVVTSADLLELDQLREASQTTQRALDALSETPHVIDHAYMQEFKLALAADEAARKAYLDRWRELFD